MGRDRKKQKNKKGQVRGKKTIKGIRWAQNVINV